MATVSIPWGAESLELALPVDWTVQHVGQTSISPAPADWPERLAGALTRPEGMPALDKLLAARPGGKISIVVEDLTRHSPLPQILAVIARELEHARVGDENVEVVFATGTHPPLTAQEAVGKVGPELAGRFAWRSNECKDRNAFQRVGRVGSRQADLDVWIDRKVAQADLRIIVSSVSPHLQAGFGGGYKMFLPGCARQDTIRRLHLMGVPRSPHQQVGQSHEVNRMRGLIDAAGQAVDHHKGTSFGVQYVLDAQDQPSMVVTGDVLVGQRLLAKTCATGCGTIMDGPADVVIAGAAPRDFDLYQSLKSVVNTYWAVRDNGVLICVARCPGLLHGMKVVDGPISQRGIRRFVRLMGADTLAGLMTRLVPGMAGDAAFFVRLALQVVQRCSVLIVSPALAEAKVKMLGLPIYADCESAFAAARDLLDKGPKRVICFPTGGISYPILPQ